MSGFSAYGLRLSAVVAVLLCSGAAQAQTLRQPRLQQIADEAALVAVQILGSGGQPADAAAVAEQAVAATPGMAAQATVSSNDLSVTVTVSAAGAKAPAVSTARYLPPDQPADWTWASRQRFAVQSVPLVIGSYCWRDCDSSR